MTNKPYLIRRILCFLFILFTISLTTEFYLISLVLEIGDYKSPILKLSIFVFVVGIIIPVCIMYNIVEKMSEKIYKN